MSEEKEPRKSVIKVGIRRAYNVGAYETLEIKVESTDEINWTTVEDRVNKTESLAKVLVAKFEKSHEVIFKGLKAVETSATYKNAASDDLGDGLPD